MNSIPDLLFHGSRTIFTRFDPKFFNSGEGVSNFKGWYFVDKLKGAAKHAESHLRDIPRPGYVYVCKVPKYHVVYDAERGWTDSCYHSVTYGVPLDLSDSIEIIEILQVELLDEETFEPFDYLLANHKARLGREMSYLRRVVLSEQK